MNKSKLPKSWYFDDKRYKLIWKKPRRNKQEMENNIEVFGYCDDPKNSPKDRTIVVNPNLEIQEFVETLIHEATHSEIWVISEEKVTNFAENLTELLFACLKIEEKD